jgi:hypothetical protein
VIFFIVNWRYNNIWIEGGLVTQVAYFSVTNLLARVAAPIFDPFYYIQRFIQWFYLNNPWKMSQIAVNQLFEEVPFDFSMYISSVIIQVLQVLFMNSMFPLTGIFCVFTQYAELTIHKWIVLRRSKMQRKFGDSLILTCLNYTDMALLTYILGCMITYRLLMGYIPSIYWVNFIIAVIFNLLPLNMITRQLIEIPEN